MQSSDTVANKYRIIKKLATGGMGELYLADYDGIHDFKRMVVVKRLHAELKEDPLYKELFFQEGVLSGKFDHPNIVHVYETDEDEIGPYMIMEYILGKDLMSIVRTSLKNKSFIPLNHAINIIIQIAEGLAYVHSLKNENGKPLDMVHRDVTPSNILITLHGFAKLVDFGVAEVKGRKSELLEGIIPGKINYMAPEVLKGEEVDGRSDIFSLGVMLYELTVGKRLFRGKPEIVREKILSKSIELPTSINPDFDPELETIILKTIDKNPLYRYTFAEELVRDLEQYALKHQLLISRLDLAQYLRSLFKVEPIHYTASPVEDESDLDWDQDGGFFDQDWKSDGYGAELPEELLLEMDDETYFEVMANPEKAKQLIEEHKTAAKQKDSDSGNKTENSEKTDETSVSDGSSDEKENNSEEQSATSEESRNEESDSGNNESSEETKHRNLSPADESSFDDIDPETAVLPENEETSADSFLSKHIFAVVSLLIFISLLIIYLSFK